MGSQDANTLSPPSLAVITPMQVTFDIPDTLAAQLTAAGKDPASGVSARYQPPHDNLSNPF